MRKETKLRKKKKRESAIKLLKSPSPFDQQKGRGFLRQVNYVPWGHSTKSNY